MLEIPATVKHHLQDLLFGGRAIAYLLLDENCDLTAAGGRLAHYGLADLRPGLPVLDQAYFLEGLLPVVDAPFCIPSMELPNGRVADLHFLLDNRATWILLVDATSARDMVRPVQQKAHEMTLLREREARLNRELQKANDALVVAQDELRASRDRARSELERKQLELAEARTLQLALMPPPFDRVVGDMEVKIDVLLEPAQEIGGDLLDHFIVRDTLVVLLVGDVSDKGAGAALMMARSHALFRSLLSRPDASALFRAPQEVVAIVNEALTMRNASCMFVTLLLAVFDTASRRLSYVRAGHVPPFLRRANGTVERLDIAGGPPLGITHKAVFRPAVLELEANEQLLIVTDGITEAVNPAGDLFGEKQISRFLNGPTPTLAGLLTEVRAFEVDKTHSDDIAALLVGLSLNYRKPFED